MHVTLPLQNESKSAMKLVLEPMSEYFFVQPGEKVEVHGVFDGVTSNLTFTVAPNDGFLVLYAPGEITGFIDHFKQINDRHGHGRGDDVLQRFAVLLRERMRRSDVICRFGGEEFVLLVDNCVQPALVDILETIMQQFSAMRFGAGGDALAGCTFSAGVAVLDVDGHDFESLVRVADARMYRAKADGRARIRTSD